ncbi:MAG: ABC transporter ATP-binding protein [Clostridia bacterium]|nr:ABC transporter ATP-binding protein [Clostridia bacterium]
MDAVLELRHVHAGYEDRPVLEDVSLVIPRHRVVGLVGESGSGKSTLARVAAGLLAPASGQVLLDGRPLSGRRDKAACRKIQMVFQNPEGSLNPRRRVGRALEEAMVFHGAAARGEAREKCLRLMERMELPADALDRLPRAFSGGQKQRVALARALAVEPELLIADEATSALDVSVQLKMLDLIRALRAERSLTILFISHDLGVIRYVCDEVVVMRAGRILEAQPAGDFFLRPQTEYGRQLLDSVPRIDF